MMAFLTAMRCYLAATVHSTPPDPACLLRSRPHLPCSCWLLRGTSHCMTLTSQPSAGCAPVWSGHQLPVGLLDLLVASSDACWAGQFVGTSPTACSR